MNLPYKRIVPSVSPKEFLATHVYEPKSSGLRFLIVSLKFTLYKPVAKTWLSYLSFVSTMVPPSLFQYVTDCGNDSKLQSKETSVFTGAPTNWFGIQIIGATVKNRNQ